MKLKRSGSIRPINISITLLLLLLHFAAFAQRRSVTVRSPDRRLSLTVFTRNKQLFYEIRADGRPVIDPSRLGLVLDSTDLGADTQITGPVSDSKIDESYAIFGNHRIARNQANEAEIPIMAGGKAASVIVRVYNDGTAIRYTIPEGAQRLNGEKTVWTLPANAGKIAWADFSQSYEGLNHVTPLNAVPEATTVMAPLTFECAGYLVSLSEADCESFSDMALLRNGNTFGVIYPFAKAGWQLHPPSKNIYLNGTYKGKIVSPWRSTMVVRSLNGLVNSDLITNLCPSPPRDLDFSWVKPGRSLWQWWSVGAPKFNEQKDWYDAAAKLRWEYYLVDDGWRDWKHDGKDQWMLLREVIDYGRSVGVRSIVWVDSKEFRKAPERQAYLAKVKASGADGIKIDFIPDATPEMMQWYAETQQECAALKLLLNFHGSVKPTGLRRTFPNDITREAIRGNEYHMTKYDRVMPLEHDVTVPFTRLLAGPADFTPVILDPNELKTQKFTWAHEFAQAIVFLSPITHFTDQYRYYLNSPMVDLIRQVPTVWDETVVLPCTRMGEIVGFARRKGKTWWIGLMNGKVAREVTVSLDFLKASGNADLVYDGVTNPSVNREKKVVNKRSILKIKLRPGGGFVSKIE